MQNGAAGVLIEAEGDENQLYQFIAELQENPPPLASIQSFSLAEIPLQNSGLFTIQESKSGIAPLPPDSDVCPECLGELLDPADRRYLYPFINCTNCGPRYSIITATPYDRPNTTMAQFPLCPECEQEYRDPKNRRFHAQPVACPVCGPHLSLLGADGRAIACDPMAEAVRQLKSGAIVAVKGVGGYHLAVDPCNAAAVAMLRERKKRDEKPFALMVETIEKARGLVQLNRSEELLLQSREKPIILLRRTENSPVCPDVAPANDYLGVMLPSAPLHYLLLKDTFQALVMTSANISDEPIIYRDEDAAHGLAGIADFILLHNRDIHTPCDDSVIRVFRTHPLLMRRSRGYVPRSVAIPDVSGSVLALGAELKSTVCLAQGGQAFLSRHIGDLKSAATLDAFAKTIDALQQITGIKAGIIAHDLHPDYHSTLFAAKFPDAAKIAVQHHHAHMASCMAENCLEGELIGVIFDGAGLGSDGTIWGGEFLTGGYGGFERAGHLLPMTLPGGDAAAREPYRVAISMLYRIFGSELFATEMDLFAGLTAVERSLFIKMLEKGINSPVTSSAGRLFDGVAALLGLRSKMSYEGQAAIELEGIAEKGRAGKPYPCKLLTEDTGTVLDWRPAIEALLLDVRLGVSRSDIAATFHHSLAVAATHLCSAIRRQSGLDRVVLSGGVFQNRILAEEMVTLLEKNDFRVYTHRLVPPNDGGLALGQAVIAGRSFKCV